MDEKKIIVSDVTQQETVLTARIAGDLAHAAARQRAFRQNAKQANFGRLSSLPGPDKTVMRSRKVVLPNGHVGERFAKHIRRAQVMAYYDSESKSVRAVIEAGAIVRALIGSVDHKLRGKVGNLLKVGKLFRAAVVLQNALGICGDK